MKICVYAICKNEMQWIDRWLNNMSEADYIVVLDTGSTDGSFEKLKDDPRVTAAAQAIINPWRFDVARNESMKLVPEDTDIYVCTDFDEIFEEGWAKVLRDNWAPDDDRCYYTYAWSHNALGEPQDVFRYDKIHTKDYYWRFPVHEILYPIDENKHEKVLDVGEAIYLHHLQDMTKERGNYFDLLEISVAENPTDVHCRMLLAREYLIKQDYENALKEYLACLDYEELYLPNRKSVLLETYGRLGDIYGYDYNDFDNSMHYYREFLKLDDTYREPYFCMGELYNNAGMAKVAVGLVEAGLNYTYRHYDWIERRDNWLAKGEKLLLVIYYNLHDYEKAVQYGKIAIAHNPDNVKLLQIYSKSLEKLLENDRSKTED